MFRLLQYIVCIGFILTYTQHANGQSKNCTQFKNGLFKLIDPEAGVSYFKRNGRKQIEWTHTKTDSSVLIVKWIDDCTYTLTPTKETLKKAPAFPSNAMLTVHIIEVRDSSYLQVTTCNFNEMKITNEVICIKR
ncbi:hypothetical protein CAP35_09425 [Chitinophagaceae bacterium IBVUCB1]|nr:hypothetical protein CAP35_09425 [Chitinophagaceae bacterium IBVUCB1]